MEKTEKIVISARGYICIYIHAFIHFGNFCPIELICYNTNKINIKETLVSVTPE